MIFKTPNGDIEYHLEIDEFLVRLLNDNDLRVTLSLLQNLRCTTLYLKDLATMLNTNSTKMAICLKKLTETGLIVYNQYKPENTILTKISFALSQKYFDDYIALDRLYNFDKDLTEEVYYRVEYINKTICDEYKINEATMQYLKERGNVK